jgi:hypothetical protein
VADVANIILGGVNKLAINDEGSSDDGIDGQEKEAVVASPCTKSMFS